MRIGVFGGSFDPPHNGHLAVAVAVKEHLHLDEVMFVPANKNPLKSRKTSSVKDRSEMVKLAIQDEPGFSFSDIETTRPGPSFAVETMDELKLVHPADYWFVLGADALKDILEWKNPQRLITLCRLAVVERRGDQIANIVHRLPNDFGYAIDIVPMPQVPVSSSRIREDVMRGAPVGHWLKPAVLEYINKVGLYKE